MENKEFIHYYLKNESEIISKLKFSDIKMFLFGMFISNITFMNEFRIDIYKNNRFLECVDKYLTILSATESRAHSASGS